MATMAKELKRIQEKEDDIGVLTIYLSTDISDQSHDKVFNFRYGDINMTDNEDWKATFYGVEEQNLLFDAVSSKTPMYFKFGTDGGSFEGRAIVTDIDSASKENVVTFKSAGPLQRT